MANMERLDELFRGGKRPGGDPDKEAGNFDVYRLEDVAGEQGTPVKNSRRDFYKIGLIRGNSRYHFAGRSIETVGTMLVFVNPQVPYTWESLPGDRTGFCCVFKEPFFTAKMKANINELPMFRAGGKPAQLLTKEQDVAVSNIFIRMLDEIPSDYLYKYDLLRNYVTEIIHLALKMQAAEAITPDSAGMVRQGQ
jgi:hypothetical protein